MSYLIFTVTEHTIEPGPPTWRPSAHFPLSLTESNKYCPASVTLGDSDRTFAGHNYTCTLHRASTTCRISNKCQGQGRCSEGFREVNQCLYFLMNVKNENLVHLD